MSIPLPKMILARHGATDWNEQRRYIGHTDQPLSELGRNQARGLGRALAHLDLDAIYCSDLRRACETACEVQQAACGEGRSLPPIIADARLREMDFGWIEGLTYEEAMARFPEEMTRWYGQMETLTPPGGTESLPGVRSRVCHFMKELSRRDYGRVLVVTHGGIINSWLAQIGKKPFWENPLGHGEWTEIEGQGVREAE
ncbi:broad specificity phosphatase PhoE [Paenibacillus forsythiae]|uniref:Broad specificity phosphatase PhoE n=1 Tax=Paenibacillus forsythiae TaxID=365616 RepID=A0ABU3HDW1_9BACL|nr:histidine phosphatase family protein [Paenibacillus forsythiae]MDT3428930.1 broad specificity phosphatase PhoE [Paenibacillus forsythiae]